jgi:hypothetical protein
MRQFVFGINREGMQTIIDAAGGNVEVYPTPPLLAIVAIAAGFGCMRVLFQALYSVP